MSVTHQGPRYLSFHHFAGLFIQTLIVLSHDCWIKDIDQIVTAALRASELFEMSTTMTREFFHKSTANRTSIFFHHPLLSFCSSGTQFRASPKFPAISIKSNTTPGCDLNIS